MNSPAIHQVDFAFNLTGLVVLALIEDINDGTPITQSDVSTITHKVRDQQGTLIAEHALVVSAVVFNALIDTDLRWMSGEAGYNFRTVVLAADLPDANKIYTASYRFVPTVGEAYGFKLTIPTRSLEYFSA